MQANWPAEDPSGHEVTQLLPLTATNLPSLQEVIAYEKHVLAEGSLNQAVAHCLQLLAEDGRKSNSARRP